MKLFKNIKRKVGNAILPVVGTILGLTVLAGSVVAVALNSSRIVYRESNLQKQNDARQILYIAARYFSDEMNKGTSDSTISAYLKTVFGEGLKITKSKTKQDTYYIWYPDSYKDGSNEYKQKADGTDNVKEWLKATVTKVQKANDEGDHGTQGIGDTLFSKKAKIDEKFAIGNLSTVYMTDLEYLPGRSYDINDISLVESDIDTFDEAFSYMSKSGVIEIDSYGIALYQYAGTTKTNTSVVDPSHPDSTDPEYTGYYLIYRTGNTGGNFDWQYTSGSSTYDKQSQIYREEYDLNTIKAMLSYYYYNYTILHEKKEGNTTYNISYNFDELHDTHNMNFYYRQDGNNTLKYKEVSWTTEEFAKNLSDYVFFNEMCRLTLKLDDVRSYIKEDMRDKNWTKIYDSSSYSRYLATEFDGRDEEDADDGEPGYCFRFTREGLQVDIYYHMRQYGSGSTYYERYTYTMKQLDDIIAEKNYKRHNLESALVLAAETNTFNEVMESLESTYSSYTMTKDLFVELMAYARYKLALERVKTTATLEDYAKKHIEDKYINGTGECTVIYDGVNYNNAKIVEIGNITLSNPLITHINGSGDNKYVDLSTYTFTVKKFKKKLEQDTVELPTDAEMLQILGEMYNGKTAKLYDGETRYETELGNRYVISVDYFELDQYGNNYKIVVTHRGSNGTGSYSGYTYGDYIKMDKNDFNRIRQEHATVIGHSGDYVEVTVPSNKTATVSGIDANFTVPYDMYVEIMNAQAVQNHDDDAIRQIVNDNETLEYLRTLMSQNIKYKYLPRTTLDEILGGKMDGSTNTQMSGYKEQTFAMNLVEYYLDQIKKEKVNSGKELSYYATQYPDYVFTFTKSEFSDIANSEFIKYTVGFKVEFKNGSTVVYKFEDTVDFIIKIVTWNLYNTDGETNAQVTVHDGATHVNGNGYIGIDPLDNKQKTLFDYVSVEDNDGNTLTGTAIKNGTKTLLGVIPLKERAEDCYYKNDYVKEQNSGDYINFSAQTMVNNGTVTINKNTYYKGTFDLKKITNKNTSTLNIQQGKTLYIDGDLYLTASYYSSGNNDLINVNIASATFNDDGTINQPGGMLFVSGNVYVEYLFIYYDTSSTTKLSNSAKTRLAGGVNINANGANVFINGNFVYRGVKSTYKSSQNSSPRDFQQGLTNADDCHVVTKTVNSKKVKEWTHDSSDLRCKLSGTFIINGDVQYLPYNTYMQHTLYTNAFSNPLMNATFYVDGVYDMSCLWTAGLYDPCRPNFIFASSIRQPEVALGTVYDKIDMTKPNPYANWCQTNGYLFMIVEDAIDFSDSNFASVNMFSPYQKLISAIENNNLDEFNFSDYFDKDGKFTEWYTMEMTDYWGLPSILKDGFKMMFDPGDIGKITVEPTFNSANDTVV